MKYASVSAPNHPRAHRSASTKTPWLQGHLVIAERALGKPLPPKAEVHHVNEDKRDNRNANLVICQDAAYHKLLHARARVVRAGGNPNTEKVCSGCRRLVPLTGFNMASRRAGLGRQSQCRACQSAYTKTYVRRKC